jgi:hypothetical protein
MAIPWLDKCLGLRLPQQPGQALREISLEGAWLAQPTGTTATPAAKFEGDPLEAGWLPDASIAKAWMQFQKDTSVVDTTPPPAPSRVELDGNRLRWRAEADVESGIQKFVILRNGKFLAEVAGSGKNRFGRQLFQNLQYSDTPTQPLAKMEFVDETAERGVDHGYSVVTVNTVGLESKPTWAAPAVGGDD